MKKQKLFYLILMAGAASINAPSVYSQAVDSLGRPTWMLTPKPQLTPSADTAVSGNVRKVRSDLFDSPESLRATAPDLTRADSGGRGSGSSVGSSMPDSLPVNSSDAIITGTISKTQPFLSTDHTWIYSELLLLPDDVIKDLSKNLIAGQSAIVLSAGGSIKFPDGRTATSVSKGESTPINVGTRYLLFLQYNGGAKAYTVSKAWDLSGEQPQELDLEGRPRRAMASDSSNTATRESLMALVKSHVDSK